MTHDVPQPGLERLTDFDGHPVVVGVVPGQDPLVALTAASVARATRGHLHLGFVDETRHGSREHPDGSVDHQPIAPDADDDGWHDTARTIEDSIARTLADEGVPWRFHYLAGRPDRALTHLARAVDASVIVVGARHDGLGARMQDFFEESIGLQLTHHQHRPVLVVPLVVADWKDGPAWR